MSRTLHTNAAGNAVLAQQWFNAIQQRYAPIDTSTYGAWQVAHFGSTLAANAASAQDPDGDGMSNLYEFAFNSNPNIFSSKSQRLEFGSDKLLLTRRTASGANLTYTLQESSSLVANGWTTVTGATEVVVSTSGNFETVEIAKPAGWVSGARNFLRLKVSMNP